MYCASCFYKLKNAIEDTDGIVNAAFGFVSNEVINGTVECRYEVVYDTSKTKPDKMLQAILSYKGTIVNDKVTSFHLLRSLKLLDSNCPLEHFSKHEPTTKVV